MTPTSRFQYVSKTPRAAVSTPPRHFDRRDACRHEPQTVNSLSAEHEPLKAHAKPDFACSEAAMEMACSRLADAESRIWPQDRIVDAVIGMSVWQAVMLSHFCASARTQRTTWPMIGGPSCGSATRRDQT